MAKRESKMWTPKGITIDKKVDKINENNLADYVLTLEYDDITYDFIMELFGSFNNKCMAHPYDLIKIPKGAFKYLEGNKENSNKNEFITGLGLWIMNVFIRDIGLSPVLGYVNTTFDKPTYKKIEKKLSYALIEDDITVDALQKYEDTIQWMMPFEDILSPNHTEKIITCTKVINKKKQELIKKYKKDIDEGNITVVEQMEKELLAYAKEYLGDDPSLDTLLSGAGGTFHNNFKNMYVMKGAIKNPDPNTDKPYNIVLSNYYDGISAEEYSTSAGSLVAAAYSRGKKTQFGGYIEKLFIAAFQHLKLDPPGSDCGTKKYIEVDFSEESTDDYMYSYIIKQNGDLELLDSKTKSKYEGKKVKMRFSSMCKSKTGICNKCAGEMFYKLNLNNVGVLMSQIPSILKNVCMKSFHDSTVQTIQMDPMKAFFPYDN